MYFTYVNSRSTESLAMLLQMILSLSIWSLMPTLYMPVSAKDWSAENGRPVLHISDARL
ncbi:hypothetical protein [Anaerobiospirillum thomasii]|uniref:hypothetical protein n=1 Tax=Anaerobiospirillum thomasii TaxID=179995 RepID=UPI001C66105C|nr:hypothetical protein [Anaerobiospirillum thomasii]